MTLDQVLAYCRSFPGVSEKYPYGPGVKVMYVDDKKTFANILEASSPLHITMKCDPFEAELLRAAFDAVKPGHHCNKRHWNSVYLDGSIPDNEVERMLWNAYCLAAGRKKEMRPATV